MNAAALISDAVNSKLGVAIITGGLGYLAQQFWVTRTFDLVGARRKALAGEWIGRATQEFEGVLRSWDIQATIDPGLKKVRGEFVLIFDPQDRKKDQHLAMTGGFQHERFLTFDYRNNQSSMVQFGSMLFYFDEDGETLRGQYVGFGHKSKKLVHGVIVLDTKKSK